MTVKIKYPNKKLVDNTSEYLTQEVVSLKLENMKKDVKLNMLTKELVNIKMEMNKEAK